MKCVSCKDRESTGIIFALCDECFDAMEAATDREAAGDVAERAFIPPDGCDVVTVRGADGGRQAVLVTRGPTKETP